MHWEKKGAKYFREKTEKQIPDTHLKVRTPIPGLDKDYLPVFGLPG